jgi:galactokinase
VAVATALAVQQAFMRKIDATALPATALVANATTKLTGTNTAITDQYYMQI